MRSIDGSKIWSINQSQRYRIGVEDKWLYARFHFGESVNQWVMYILFYWLCDSLNCYWICPKIIAITVEEEEDIAKFKDYSPSAGSAPSPTPAPKEPSAPTPQKQEAPKQPVTSPEPKVSQPSSSSPAGDRIFASPLARKLAEDNKVNDQTIKLLQVMVLGCIVGFQFHVV